MAGQQEENVVPHRNALFHSRQADGFEDLLQTFPEPKNKICHILARYSPLLSSKQPNNRFELLGCSHGLTQLQTQLGARIFTHRQQSPTFVGWRFCENRKHCCRTSRSIEQETLSYHEDTKPQCTSEAAFGTGNELPLSSVRQNQNSHSSHDCWCCFLFPFPVPVHIYREIENRNVRPHGPNSTRG